MPTTIARSVFILSIIIKIIPSIYNFQNTTIINQNSNTITNTLEHMKRQSLSLKQSEKLQQQQHPLLNVTCNDERNRIIARKQGLANILRCCSQILMCECMNKQCETNPLYKSGVWCKQLEIHPCDSDPSCHDLITVKKCLELPDVSRVLFIILIVLGISIALAILVLICMVCYKKIKAYRSMSKSKRSKLRMALAPRPNVTSQIMYVNTTGQIQSKMVTAASTNQPSLSVQTSNALNEASNNSYWSIMNKRKISGTSASASSSAPSSNHSTNYQRNSNSNFRPKCRKNSITKSFLQKAVS